MPHSTDTEYKSRPGHMRPKKGKGKKKMAKASEMRDIMPKERGQMMKSTMMRREMVKRA